MMIMIMMMETQNGNNSANFKATTSRFCMVIDINDTYKLYFHENLRFILQISLCIHI